MRPFPLEVATQIEIREIRRDEFELLGRLLVEAYSALEGFPKPEDEPEYYELLANIGQFAEKKDASVLVAASPAGAVLGGVVYFGDMAEYGAGGIARTLTDASGIRLLGVAPEAQGTGAGTALTVACIERARARGHSHVVLHTTRAMSVAWRMYEKLGFVRSPELDFSVGALRVFGFTLALSAAARASADTG